MGGFPVVGPSRVSLLSRQRSESIPHVEIDPKSTRKGRLKDNRQEQSAYSTAQGLSAKGATRLRQHSHDAQFGGRFSDKGFYSGYPGAADSHHRRKGLKLGIIRGINPCKAEDTSCQGVDARGGAQAFNHARGGGGGGEHLFNCFAGGGGPQPRLDCSAGATSPTPLPYHISQWHASGSRGWLSGTMGLAPGSALRDVVSARCLRAAGPWQDVQVGPLGRRPSDLEGNAALAVQLESREVGLLRRRKGRWRQLGRIEPPTTPRWARAPGLTLHSGRMGEDDGRVTGVSQSPWWRWCERAELDVSCAPAAAGSINAGRTPGSTAIGPRRNFLAGAVVHLPPLAARPRGRDGRLRPF